MLLHLVEALTSKVQPREAIDKEVGQILKESGNAQTGLRKGTERRRERGTQIPEGDGSLGTELKEEAEGRKMDGEMEMNSQELERNSLLATTGGDSGQVSMGSRGEELSWNGFKEVYMVSALTGDGVEQLRVSVCVCVRGRGEGGLSS